MASWAASPMRLEPASRAIGNASHSPMTGKWPAWYKGKAQRSIAARLAASKAGSSSVPERVRAGHQDRQAARLHQAQLQVLQQHDGLAVGDLAAGDHRDGIRLIRGEMLVSRGEMLVSGLTFRHFLDQSAAKENEHLLF